MNLLKSIFISAFIAWLVVISSFALSRLATGTEPLLSWLGLSLAALPPLGFFIKAFLARSPRTARHPVEVSVPSALGLAITMTIAYRYGETAGNIHVLAGITVLAWFAYLRWYSVFGKRDSASLKTGNPLPDFRLESLEGHLVSSESFKAKPHLLLFYRGNWCPFCTAQIDELAAAWQELAELGLSVVLISPQSGKKNQSIANRFNVPMTFLSDPDSAAARQLGILHSWGTPMGLQLLGYASDTVMPTVIMTDKQGRIIYTDQTDNYRVRPEPGVYKAILEAGN